MSTTNISPSITFTAQETLSAGVAAASDPQITHNGFNLASSRLDADSTVPVSKASYQDYTLDGSGDATVDLSSLAGVGSDVHDCTGLKLQTLIIANPAGNGTLTMSPGASNPYPVFGTGNSIEIPAGSTFACTFADTLADVAGAVKEIDFAGTAADSFSLGICLG